LSDEPAVLDASVAVDALLGGARGKRARSAIDRHLLVAPAHIDLEVASALARLQRAGTLTSHQTARLLPKWQALPADRIPLSILFDTAWALRGSLRISYAFYAAAALRCDCPLLTSDSRLARAGVKGLQIHLLG